MQLLVRRAIHHKMLRVQTAIHLIDLVLIRVGHRRRRLVEFLYFDGATTQIHQVVDGDRVNWEARGLGFEGCFFEVF